LRYGGSANELCHSKLVHQSYGSQVFQGCRWPSYLWPTVFQSIGPD
jgi:hypothetical protein